MTTRNEAAERLRAFVEDELQPQFKTSAGYRDWCKASVRYFDEALAAEYERGRSDFRRLIANAAHDAQQDLCAAERRATVERIREQIPKQATRPEWRFIRRILDEEAQR